MTTTAPQRALSIKNFPITPIVSPRKYKKFTLQFKLNGIFDKHAKTMSVDNQMHKITIFIL